MEQLTNSFSVLELDADESEVQPLSLPSPPIPSATTSGGSGKRVNGKAGTLPAKNEKQDQQNPVTPLCEYRLPLVWIDLEMTGLNIEVDRILEIACIITDGNLAKTVEGPDLVIHQTKECLDRMGEWCQSHHAASARSKGYLQRSSDEIPLPPSNFPFLSSVQVKKMCPNDPDAAKKLKECEKAVMKLKFEEAISVPQSERRSIAESIDFHTIGIKVLVILETLSSEKIVDQV